MFGILGCFLRRLYFSQCGQSLLIVRLSLPPLLSRERLRFLPLLQLSLFDFLGDLFRPVDESLSEVAAKADSSYYWLLRMSCDGSETESVTALADSAVGSGASLKVRTVSAAASSFNI